MSGHRLVLLSVRPMLRARIGITKLHTVLALPRTSKGAAKYNKGTEICQGGHTFAE